MKIESDVRKCGVKPEPKKCFDAATIRAAVRRELGHALLSDGGRS